MVVWCAFVLVAASTTVPRTKYELLDYDPKADDAATHLAGHARFSLLRRLKQKPQKVKNGSRREWHSAFANTQK